MVVNTNALIFRPCAALIIPECIGVRAGCCECADGFGEAEIEETPKGFAGFGAIEGIPLPGIRCMNIFRCWDCVIITG